ncbi:MAG: hypothetical protein ABR987_24445 [Terracidiphilus sp.]
MPIDQSPLPERVAKYYSQLSAAAKDLNSISDELGKSVAEIDFALKKLNLGVIVWVPIHKDDGNPIESWYWSEDIGYAKIGPNWGICLRKVIGDYQRPDEDERVECWLFNDSPRALRISAIEKIPDLLEKLSQEAVRTTNDIRARLSEVQAVAEAVKGAANSTQRVPLRILDRDSKAAGMTAAVPDAEVVPGPALPPLEAVRRAISSALAEAGHDSAAQLLGTGTWTLEATSLRIEVPGMGKKMLALTVNAAAEKIIRQELQRLSAPTRFLIVPGVGAAANSDSGALANAVPEVEK